MRPTFFRKFQVSDDFQFAVAIGPGEDYYDGWFIAVHDLSPAQASMLP
jgi:hypothetical protein